LAKAVRQKGMQDYLSTMNNLKPEEISDVIQMALSDHVTFADIRHQYDLSEAEVKKLMRSNLKSGSYRAWRKRVVQFSSRREFYK
jgi:uncharacterized protein (TIGR03643 family)